MSLPFFHSSVVFSEMTHQYYWPPDEELVLQQKEPSLERTKPLVTELPAMASRVVKGQAFTAFWYDRISIFVTVDSVVPIKHNVTTPAFSCHQTSTGDRCGHFSVNMITINQSCPKTWLRWRISERTHALKSLMDTVHIYVVLLKCLCAFRDICHQLAGCDSFLMLSVGQAAVQRPKRLSAVINMQD